MKACSPLFTLIFELIDSIKSIKQTKQLTDITSIWYYLSLSLSSCHQQIFLWDFSEKVYVSMNQYNQKA